MNRSQYDTKPPPIEAGSPGAGKSRWHLQAGTVRASSMVLALVAVWIIFSFLTGGLFLGPRNFSNLIPKGPYWLRRLAWTL